MTPSSTATKLYDRTSDQITLDEVERICDLKELGIDQWIFTKDCVGTFKPSSPGIGTGKLSGCSAQPLISCHACESPY